MEQRRKPTWPIEEIKSVLNGRQRDDALFGSTVEVTFGQPPTQRVVTLSPDNGTLQIADPVFGSSQMPVREVQLIEGRGLLFVLSDGQHKGYVSAELYLPPSELGAPGAVAALAPRGPTDATAEQSSLRFLGKWQEALERKRRGEKEPVEQIVGRITGVVEFYNSRGKKPKDPDYQIDRAKFPFIDNDDASGEIVTVQVDRKQVANVQRLGLRVGQAINLKKAYRKVDFEDWKTKQPLAQPQKRIWALVVSDQFDEKE